MWDDICANYPSLILQCIHVKCPMYNYYTIATCAITVCQLTIKIQGWRYSLVTEMVCLPGMRETRGWMPSIHTQSKNTEGAGRRWLSWLRVLVALAKDPDSTPRTNVKAHNCLILVPGSDALLVDSVGTRHIWSTQTQCVSLTFLKKLWVFCLQALQAVQACCSSKLFRKPVSWVRMAHWTPSFLYVFVFIS